MAPETCERKSRLNSSDFPRHVMGNFERRTALRRCQVPCLGDAGGEAFDKFRDGGNVLDDSDPRVNRDDSLVEIADEHSRP